MQNGQGSQYQDYYFIILAPLQIFEVFFIARDIGLFLRQEVLTI